MEKQQLDKAYWDKRYNDQSTGWDIGYVSTPLKEYFDQISDKNISILIPGCGNAYEAVYLMEHGFTNLTLIDISPIPVQALEKKLAAYLGNGLRIICGDFFELKETFDLIIEQTFFCALDPSLRNRYADKMYALLKPGGKLAGVMFNREFEGGPPFGGNTEEYIMLFAPKFKIDKMESCYNSIEPRQGTEVFVILMKV